MPGKSLECFHLESSDKLEVLSPRSVEALWFWHVCYRTEEWCPGDYWRRRRRRGKKACFALLQRFNGNTVCPHRLHGTWTDNNMLLSRASLCWAAIHWYALLNLHLNKQAKKDLPEEHGLVSNLRIATVETDRCRFNIRVKSYSYFNQTLHIQIMCVTVHVLTIRTHWFLVFINTEAPTSL